MTEQIIDLGGFDQFDLNGTNILVFEGGGTKADTLFEYLSEIYTEAQISFISEEGESFSSEMKQKIESNHYSFLFALFSGDLENLHSLEEQIGYFLEITEMMGSTTVFLLMESCPQQKRSPFQEKVNRLSEKILDFKEFHLNPASLFIFPYREKSESAQGDDLAQIAVSMAQKQDSGVFVSTELARDYNLPVWTSDE